MSRYQTKIAAICAAKGLDGIEARIIEAWMRDEHGTLDGLSPAQFGAAVTSARLTAIAAGDAINEELARSYGM